MPLTRAEKQRRRSLRTITRQAELLREAGENRLASTLKRLIDDENNRDSLTRARLETVKALLIAGIRVGNEVRYYSRSLERYVVARIVVIKRSSPLVQLSFINYIGTWTTCWVDPNNISLLDR